MYKLWAILFSVMTWSSAFCGIDGIKTEETDDEAASPRLPQPQKASEVGYMISEENWTLPVDPFVAARGGWFATPDMQEALARLTRARNPVAAFYLGKVFSDLGDEVASTKCNTLAKEVFLSALRDSAASPFQKALAFWYLYLLNNKEGSIVKARDTLQEAPASEKTSVSFLLWDAYLTLMNKEHAASIALLQEIQGTDPRAFLYQADIYVRQGHYTEAIDACLQALSHNISEGYEVLYEIATIDKGSFPIIAVRLREASLEHFDSPQQLLEKAGTAKAYAILASDAMKRKDFASAERYYAESANKGLPHYFQQAAELSRRLGKASLASEYERLIGPFSSQFNVPPYIRRLSGEAFGPS